MNVLSSLRVFLSRREWVYLLSLLVPFVAYDLALKAYNVAWLPGEHGLSRALGLILSDVSFDLGYALLWVGLFAATRRRGLLRLLVIVLFHAATVLMVVVTTCAHQYFRQNGTTLDYATIAEWIPKLEEIMPILTQGVPLSAWVLLFAALFYATFGPYLVTRAVERRLGRPGRRYRAPAVLIPSFSGPLGLLLLALLFVFLSPLAGSDPAGANTSFARAPFVNVVWTGVEEAAAEEVNPDASAAESVSSAADASLAQAPGAEETASANDTVTAPRPEKRNVALIHLESARARSVTPYNKDLKTTPFLDELTKSSLLVERAYVVVPRSSKATVTVNCGVEPPLFYGPEFEPGGIPSRCLADLLEEEGYNTVFFQSSSEIMDQYGAVAQNLGYQEYYPSEVMDQTGFVMTNYVSYEDDIMLEPSEAWLKENGDEPFLVQYLTGTGHDEYLCVPNRYGAQDFVEDDLINRYLNCMSMLDHFLKNLIDQYKELGLYEDTIFVIYGDHGEGFGEHGRFLHGDTIYEEGLRVPLLIHASDWFEGGERAKGLSNQTDVVPTVLEMLGYRVENGEYPGYSLLHPLPEDRTLRFSCITERKCLASIKGHEKYIHHYGDQPDEIFDLSEDPLEERNLAGEYSREEIDQRRENLIAWRSGVNAGYGGE